VVRQKSGWGPVMKNGVFDDAKISWVPGGSPIESSHMGMDQYLLIPFLGDEHPFTSYFDVHQGYKVLTHCHIPNIQKVAVSPPATSEIISTDHPSHFCDETI